jgi:probable rRNA maturation factor
LEVLVLNRQRSYRVRRDVLAGFANQVADEFPPQAADSLAVMLVSDRKMREYNKRFRGQDRATDVLSFPVAGDTAPEGERHLGDILISVSTAAAQAGGTRGALERELKLLVLHGYLHLLGYDHEVDDGEMMQLQRRLARRLLPPAGADKR